MLSSIETKTNIISPILNFNLAKEFIEPVIRERATIMSPLRYPGGKRRLGTFLIEILKLNKLRPKLLVEPFAGGASIALQLLYSGYVEKIALGEKDPLVASFWKVIFNDHLWLIDQIKQIKPTLEAWDYYKKTEFNDQRSRALACLYLNRTSFSGILAAGAGPLGGRLQESDYKIDCRFNKETLIRRIKEVAKLKPKVLFIKEGEWLETINIIQQTKYREKEVFYYFDPPFYEKASKLYRHYFAEENHVALRDYLRKLKQPWVLSYDPAQRIRELYSDPGTNFSHVGLLYSARGNSELQKSKELIITNMDILPESSRLWRSAQEWKK